MSDLIERLRKMAATHERGFPVTILYSEISQALDIEAADRITALEKENAELRAAVIEECAKLADEKASQYEGEGRDVRNSPDDKRFSASVAVRLRGLAAAIRRIKPSEAEGRETE